MKGIIVFLLCQFQFFNQFGYLNTSGIVNGNTTQLKSKQPQLVIYLFPMIKRNTFIPFYQVHRWYWMVTTFVLMSGILWLIQLKRKMMIARDKEMETLYNWVLQQQLCIRLIFFGTRKKNWHRNKFPCLIPMKFLQLVWGTKEYCSIDTKKGHRNIFLCRTQKNLFVSNTIVMLHWYEAERNRVA